MKKPKRIGMPSRASRCGSSFRAGSLSMPNFSATPEMKNSSGSRHGLMSRIAGSSTCEANGLFTCQSQVT
jgi:hypothetical protein